jgi:dienelactone hydrolase
VRPSPFLLLCFLAAAAPCAQAKEVPDPADALARLVDLADPAARARQAERLAADEGVPLETWRQAMVAFGTFRRVAPGVRDHRVTLRVLGQDEPTLVTVLVPASYDPAKPAPLLMTFHGSGGDGRQDHRWWQAVAEALGMIIVSPTDPRGMPGFTGSAAEHAAAWAALRWARRTFNVDERRIFASGVSRGGHLLWDLALRRPDRFAAIAPMIGGPLLNMAGGRNNLRYAENVADLTIRDLQGARDDPLLVSNLRLLFERLKAYGARDARLVEFPGLGHAYEHGAVDWKSLLEGTRRPLVPARVVRRAARAGEGRSHWVEILETKAPAKEVFALKVDPRRWRGMAPEKQRAWIAVEAEKRTARLEARMEARGRFVVETSGVRKFRLLLDATMFEAGQPVELTVDGRRRKRKVKLDKALLLREFAERFDRTFLPVAQVVR